jgi:O-antigen ligase/polysaccharide polymerase Wzy-like membrane protein
VQWRARSRPAALGALVDVGVGVLAFVVASALSLTLKARHGIPSFVIPLALAVGALALLDARRRGRAWPWRPGRGLLGWSFLLGVAALAAYLLAQLASVIVATDRGGALHHVGGWARETVIVGAVLVAVDGPRRLRAAAWGLTAALALLSIPSLVQAATGTWTNDMLGLAVPNHGFVDGALRWRAGGPLGDANAYAQWLVILLPVALERATAQARTVLRIGAAATAACAIAAVLVSQSRGGLLALVVVGAVLLWRARSPRVVAAVALAVVAVVLVAGPGRVGRQISRFDEVTAVVTRHVEKSYSSESGRVSTFWAGAYMWRDHPVLGVGFANYEDEYLPYAKDLAIDSSGKVRSAHTAVIEVAAETGSVGLVAFATLVVAAAAISVRAVRALREVGDRGSARLVGAMQLGGVAWAVTSLFLNLAHPQVPLFILGLLLASGRVAAVPPRGRQVGPVRADSA